MDEQINDMVETIHQLEKENAELKLRLVAVSGSLLLHDLFQVANIKNEDGMPVIKYVDKPNGGSVAYVRHDAMVKKLNTLLKQWPLTVGYMKSSLTTGFK